MTDTRTESVDKKRLALGAVTTLAGIGVALLVGFAYFSALEGEDREVYAGVLGLFVVILSGFLAGFVAVRRTYKSGDRQVSYAGITNCLLVALLLAGLVIGGEGDVDTFSTVSLLLFPYLGFTIWGARVAQRRDQRSDQR